jgi:hypothetical protein
VSGQPPSLHNRKSYNSITVLVQSHSKVIPALLQCCCSVFSPCVPQLHVCSSQSAEDTGDFIREGKMYLKNRGERLWKSRGKIHSESKVERQMKEYKR